MGRVVLVRKYDRARGRYYIKAIVYERSGVSFDYFETESAYKPIAYYRERGYVIDSIISED